MPVTKRRTTLRNESDWLGLSYRLTGNMLFDPLGDSVTAGTGVTPGSGLEWWYKLDIYMAGRLDLNLGAVTVQTGDGFAGYSTGDLISTGKAAVVIAHNPALVLMEACNKNDWGQNTAISTTQANIAALYDSLRSGLPRARVLIWTPNPSSPDTANALGLQVADYVQATRDVCAGNGFALIDVYGSYVAQCAAASVSVASTLADGVHPNASGQQCIVNALVSYLFRR